jgi:hypothetical protein
LSNLPASQVQSIYNSLGLSKSKDKINMILEPLQSMCQLAILGTKPVGSKLTISNNILSIQEPSVIQPVSRWYNSDKKDDIYFLFQVIKRFIKWYSPKNNKQIITKELYELIIHMAQSGLDKLIQTYTGTNNNSIVQVIHMYKNILQNQNIKDFDNSNEKINIDEVFEKIVEIYNDKILLIMCNILNLLNNEESAEYISSYTNGFNQIMCKTNVQIQNWIKLNLQI